MTIGQMLLFGYLVLSFIAALIVYAACAIAGRQANKPVEPKLPRTGASFRYRKPPIERPQTATPALLHYEAKPRNYTN